MLTGSYLCRAIRYEVSVPVTELRACHPELGLSQARSTRRP